MVKSKRQWRFMQMLAQGGKTKPGLSKEQAQEFIDSTRVKYKKLPEKVK